MWRLFLYAIVFCGLAASADAAVLCTSPQEMKVLQAAALQQQLMAAAQSCHFSADYGRFVSSFGGAIVKSDRALKAFFQRRKEAEGYNGYKTRIAKAVSFNSLHDPRFCPSAKQVFDMAFKRGGVKASPAPSLVRTGYEGCRKLPAPIMASRQVPAVALAAAVPVPRAAPRLAVNTPQNKKTVAVNTAPPPARKIISAAAPRLTENTRQPASATVLASRSDPELQTDQPETVQRVAVADPPRWRRSERRPEPRSEEDWEEGDPYGAIPNAYRPGAVWVNDEPPRRRRAPARMGPDGGWYAVFRWQDD